MSETNSKPGRKPEDGETRRPFPVGFTSEDRDKIREIQEAEGLNSEAAAVRHAVRETHEQLTEDD